MTDAERLDAAGETLARIADRLSATFARELAWVLLQAERALMPLLHDALAGDRTARGIAANALTMRTELRAVLTRAGYDALVRQASIETVAQMADTFRASGLARNAGRLGTITPARLEAFARLLELDLLGLGDEAAHAVWRASVQAIYTQRPADTLLIQLARQLHKSLARARTLFDTAVSIVGRQIELVLTEDRPDDQAYLYVGPVDAITRDWCLAHVGKVYTRDAIESLDNGQLPNPFLTGGGYNCRHSFLAVADPAVVALANRDQRADGYDQRVALAQTLKAQQQRFRELRRAA